MGLNRNWLRWIKASVASHFQAHLEGNQPSLTMYMEGGEHIDRTGKYITKLPNWCEFRLDGPYWKELSHNYYQLRVECNILLSVRPQGDDYYLQERLQGNINTAFVRNLSVMRLGDDPEVDTNDLLGCMVLHTDGREFVTTSNFGLVEPDVQLIQSTIEGHYRMNLKGE